MRLGTVNLLSGAPTNDTKVPLRLVWGLDSRSSHAPVGQTHQEIGVSMSLTGRWCTPNTRMHPRGAMKRYVAANGSLDLISGTAG